MTYQLLPKKGIARATLLADLADSESDVFVAVAAIAGGVRRSGLVAFCGDSITQYEQGVTGGTGGAKNYTTFLAMLSNARIRKHANFAVAGHTLAQILSTQIPQVLALDPLPESCIVAGGTNDAENYETNMENLQACVAALAGAGIRPVLWLVPPRNDAKIDAAPTWNAMVRRYASVNGFQVIDAYTPLVDPSTGGFRSGKKLDDVHPNGYGHYAIAAYNVELPGWVERFGDATPYLVAAPNDPTMLISASTLLFAADTDANGLSDGWTSWGDTDLVKSRSTDAEGYVWQRITHPGTLQDNGGLTISNITTGYSAGDLISLAFLMNTSAEDMSPTVALSCRNGSTTLANAYAAFALLGGTMSGVAYAEVTVPATTDNVRIDITVPGAALAGSAYVEFARMTIINHGQ